VAAAIDYDKLAASLIKGGLQGPRGPAGPPGPAAPPAELPPITVRTIDDEGRVRDSVQVPLGGTLNLQHKIRP